MLGEVSWAVMAQPRLVGGMRQIRERRNINGFDG